MADLVSRGLRTLCFAKSRKRGRARPPVHRRAPRRRLGALALPRRLHAAQRREIERRLARGRAARRLGDQRARARDRHRPARLRDLGRLPRHRRVAAPAVGPRGPPRPRARVLVASEDALDQYFMREPETLLGRRVEAAILDHENPRVLDGHVRAAAFEAPARRRRPRDARRRGARAGAPSSRSCSKTPGGLRLGRPRLPGRADLAPLGRARVVHDRRRARAAPCSASSSGTRAYSTVHEGAVYLHLGESYRVRELDLSARARPSSSRSRGDYYTQAKKETDDRDRRAAARRAAARARARLRARSGHRAGGRLPAASRSRRRNESSSSRSTCRRPSSRPRRSGSCPSRGCSRGSRRCRGCSGSLHAAEHSLIALLPLWAMCDRWDIGGLSTNLHFQTGRPTIFVYDGHAGGVGITERGFEAFEGWVEDTAKLLAGCPCERRLPVMRPEPEVREPERAARQGGGTRTARADARAGIEFRPWSSCCCSSSVSSTASGRLRARPARPAPFR